MIDIIIPTFCNPKGLQLTLDSIPKRNDLTITVIDDHSSQVDYSNLRRPNLIILDKNVGPGMVRQYGIEHTHEPFIMFIDTGDYFFENIFDEIVETIQNHPQVQMFSWQHLYKDKPCTDKNNRLHGRVYRRQFLEKYGIHFSKDGSRANEDVGFNRACRIIIKHLGIEENYLFIEKPIIQWVVDPNSITQRDNCAFSYEKQNLGLAINDLSAIDICRKNNIPEELLIDEINEIMVSEHYFFIATAQLRPEFLKQAWDGAKLYYEKAFKQYESNNFSSFQVTFSYSLRRMRQRLKDGKWKNTKIPINIRRFLDDLKKYENPPEWYT